MSNSRYYALSLLFFFAVINSQAQSVSVVDINPGAAGSNPHYLTNANFGTGISNLFYIANDGTHGYELHRLDSVLHDSLIYDLNPSGDGIDLSQSKDMAFSYNNSRVLYFGANNGSSGNKLFYYLDHGNPAPSASNSSTAGYIGDMLATGGTVYFTRKDISGGYVYNINSLSGPLTLRKFTTPGGGVEPWGYSFGGSNVYVTEQTATAGRELFIVKSSPDTLLLAADIEPGAASSNPMALTNAFSKLFFYATTTANGRELYSYDGTTLTQLTNTPAPVNSFCVDSTALTVFGTGIYFNGRHPVTGTAGLFRFNTATNAVEVVDTTNVYDAYSMRAMYNWGDRLFYNRHYAGGNQLWVYDGNTTAMVADFGASTSAVNTIREMTGFGRYLVLIAEDAAHGSEIFTYLPPPLAIKTPAFSGTLLVAPNPVHNVCQFTLTLKEPQQVQILLTDLNGKSVYSGNSISYSAGSHQIPVSTASLVPGLYTYTLLGSTRVLVSGTIVKQ